MLTAAKVPTTHSESCPLSEVRACPSRCPGAAQALRIGPSQSYCITPGTYSGRVPAMVIGRGKPSPLGEAGFDTPAGAPATRRAAMPNQGRP